MLLVPDVELEGGVCALAIVIIIDSESKLSPITENNSIDAVLLWVDLFSSFFMDHMLYVIRKQ